MTAKKPAKAKSKTKRTPKKRKKATLCVIPEWPDDTESIAAEIKDRKYFVVVINKGDLFPEVIPNKGVLNTEIIVACQAIIAQELGG